MDSITWLPGRELSPGTVVDVYRNLNEQKRAGAVVWSVRARSGEHKGKVCGHARAVALYDVSTHVGERAQARIAAGAPREVHAWVTGKLQARTPREDVPGGMTRATYRPHIAPTFVTESGDAYTGGDAAVFTSAGMYVG